MTGRWKCVSVRIALVLGLQVVPPLDRIVERFARLLQNLDRLGVRQPNELADEQFFQVGDQIGLDVLIEQLHVVGTLR